MSRNSPVGQPGTRAPGRRSAADLDQYPSGQSAWPPPEGADPLQQGYAPHGPLGAPQQHSQGGYYFPQPVEPGHAIAAWAWAASRVVDYLATDPVIDANRIGIAGHSRMGKTALWAAAGNAVGWPARQRCRPL